MADDRCGHCAPAGLDIPDGMCSTRAPARVVPASLDTWEESRTSADLAELSREATYRSHPHHGRTVSILAASGDPALERMALKMARCGAWGHVRLDPAAERAVWHPYSCDQRLCTVCHAHKVRATRRKLRWLLRRAEIEGDWVRFGTLTLARGWVKEGPAAAIAAAKAAFARLRRPTTRYGRHEDRWGQCVTGAMAAFEANWDGNGGGGGWNPHVHFLAVGSYWDQRDLARRWEEATRGAGGVVWIEAVGVGLAELTKYHTKAAYLPEEQVIRWAREMRGVQLRQWYGQWRGLNPPVERCVRLVVPVRQLETCASRPVDPDDYVPELVHVVGRLMDVAPYMLEIGRAWEATLWLSGQRAARSTPRAPPEWGALGPWAEILALSGRWVTYRQPVTRRWCQRARRATIRALRAKVSKWC